MRIVDDRDPAKTPHKLPGQFCDNEARDLENGETQQESACFSCLLKPLAQLTHDCRTEQRQPENEERNLRQLKQELSLGPVRCQRKYDGHELSDEQNNE